MAAWGAAAHSAVAGRVRAGVGRGRGAVVVVLLLAAGGAGGLGARVVGGGQWAWRHACMAACGRIAGWLLGGRHGGQAGAWRGQITRLSSTTCCLRFARHSEVDLRVGRGHAAVEACLLAACVSVPCSAWYQEVGHAAVGGPAGCGSTSWHEEVGRSPARAGQHAQARQGCSAATGLPRGLASIEGVHVAVPHSAAALQQVPCRRGRRPGVASWRSRRSRRRRATHR